MLKRHWLLALAVVLAGACEGSGNELPPPTMMVPNTPVDPNMPPVLGPPAPVATPHACDVSLRELSVFQGVKVPLFSAGQPAVSATPIIENRRSLFRAYVVLGPAVARGNARARLRLSSSRGHWAVESEGYVGRASLDDNLSSTFNFDVPAGIIQGDLRVAIDLELGTDCAAAGRTSLPATGMLPVTLVNTGTLRITLVPIAYDADGSGRLPDVSDAQVQSYRDLLVAMYPVSTVEVTVRAPVRSSIALTAGTGWRSLLEAVGAQRTADRAGAEVHYYALVAPAATFGNYCNTRQGCIAGLSYLADQPSGRRQVGAGIGFTGTVAGDTLVHELGHQHGRGHAPCAAEDGLDGAFPYQGAGLGVWGFDFRLNERGLRSPVETRDLMSYCEPIWISDYTFTGLSERRRAIANGGAAAKIVHAPWAAPPRSQSYRSLLVGEGPAPVWGLPLAADVAPDGQPETAEVLDAAGNLVKSVLVYKTGYGHGTGASYDVPAAQPGWDSLRVQGQPAVRFGAASSVPELQAY